MAKTQVPSGYIEDDAITTAKIADNTIQAAHLHSSHGITTNNIGEHTNNKYYTDARVDTRLAASKSSNFVTTGNIDVDSDSGKLRVGAGADLQIYHDATNSYIDNGTGHLYIKNNTNDADIVLQTDDGSGGVTTYLTIDGSSEVTFASKPITFFDNIKANFGNSSDAQIYHNGTHLFIDETDSGRIFIRSSDEVRINKYTGEFMIRAIADGAVTLYHDNSAKIATTSGGVSVTGAITASGDATINNKITFTYNDHYLQTGTNSISFKNSVGTSYATLSNTGLSVTSDLTVGGNTTITGNLTVNGTSTTISTATLDVEDKNITLNKGSGDTSSTADGAGITIQDAVDASNDASLTWNAAGDKFVTSHALDVTGALTSTTINTGQGATEVYLMNQNVRTSDNANFASYQVGGTTVIASDRTMNNIPSIGITQTASNSYGQLEMLGTSGAYIDLKNSSSDDYDMRFISFGTGGEIVSGSGDIVIKRQGSTKLSTSAAGITVTGSLTSDTISSGAITSTGDITLGDDLNFSTNGFADISNTGTGAMRFKPTSQTLALTLTGANAEFAGTISSGAITSSGTFTKSFDVGNDVTIGNDSTYGTSGTGRYVTLGLGNTGNGGNRIFAHNTGGDGIYIASATSRDINFRTNGSGQNAFRVSASGTVDMGASNTTVIDASRNLTNIGTISSGAITASATSTIQGNLLLDVDNAEINLKSGVGTTSGAVNWTFNSTGTDYASIKLPYATRASKGLWIDSGYPITIDATTRIDFDITGSTRMDLDNSGLGVTGTVVASGNVQHTGLTMTSGTDIDQLITATDSLTLSDAWQDTSIAGSDLASGTYIVQVYVNDFSVGGGHYAEFYSGTMSWTSAATNSSQKDEIILHRAGHAPNTGDIYLRTERRLQSGDSGTLMLQIRGSTSNSGASNYIFKFRRMI